jgi:hypothetical protein
MPTKSEILEQFTRIAERLSKTFDRDSEYKPEWEIKRNDSSFAGARPTLIKWIYPTDFQVEFPDGTEDRPTEGQLTQWLKMCGFADPELIIKYALNFGSVNVFPESRHWERPS